MIPTTDDHAATIMSHSVVAAPGADLDRSRYYLAQVCSVHRGNSVRADRFCRLRFLRLRSVESLSPGWGHFLNLQEFTTNTLLTGRIVTVYLQQNTTELRVWLRVGVGEDI